MTIEQFESLSLVVGIGGLLLFLALILWKLARDSKAGRFGTVVLFIALGLGVVGFIIKSVLVAWLEK